MAIPNLVQASWKTSAYSGRLRLDTGHPVTNGYVFVIDLKGNVLGYSKTDPTLRPDSGRWQIVSLPVSEKITFIGFHPKYKTNLAVEEITTKGGFHKFNRLEINLSYSGFSPDDSVNGPLGLLALIGEIIKEVNRVWGEKEAGSLTDFLLSQVPKLSDGVATESRIGKSTVAPIKREPPINNAPTTPKRDSKKVKTNRILSTSTLPFFPNSRKDPYIKGIYRSYDHPSKIVSWYETKAKEKGLKTVTRSSGGKYHVFVSTTRTAAEKVLNHKPTETPVIIIGVWERRGSSKESTRYQIVVR